MYENSNITFIDVSMSIHQMCFFFTINMNEYVKNEDESSAE